MKETDFQFEKARLIQLNVKPSVGRIVHYVSYGTPGGEFASECRAAVIAEVHDSEEVTLCVMNPSGIFFNRANRWEDDHKGGTWHWPERVE